jgi:hypothetical protein
MDLVLTNGILPSTNMAIYCRMRMRLHRQRRFKDNLNPRDLRFLHVGKMTEEVTSALYYAIFAMGTVKENHREVLNRSSLHYTSYRI